jgi:hypothetical protein
MAEASQDVGLSLLTGNYQRLSGKSQPENKKAPTLTPGLELACHRFNPIT